MDANGLDRFPLGQQIRNRMIIGRVFKLDAKHVRVDDNEMSRTRFLRFLPLLATAHFKN
ncbi:protein of unknown function [Candidatus Filomicrobium marinum]|uniref:Uncharacterized protein n=1 Tax=Candidatus Filomicrobium marinum TaxID=1608628 RepID=A0A0D6JDS9_9HYPH|nr:MULTISPECIES: hypothetical protein [Filomicrobium]MCV0368088.1 hypothetical protein [Filomicrobium sp.]CFX14921.1 protein of unknown function [Candidatus Filomicrobium marinum]CPR17877.1 protein of unknown function [Candidatus Filomicrobium marinum]